MKKLPIEIVDVINVMNKNNKEIYLVGGFVRDMLLDNKSPDVDMTTIATPEEMKLILNKYELNTEYSNYGCIKFKVNKYNFELTTYRKEYNYVNYRRPSKIEFIDSLEEDLKRRDFTINAICYDGDKIIDKFDGMKDLKNKIIKTIGDPFIRLEEDALRILRALRFSCSLGFDLDKELICAIMEKSCLLDKLNKGLKNREWSMIKESEYYKEISNKYRELFNKVERMII